MNVMLNIAYPAMISYGVIERMIKRVVEAESGKRIYIVMARW